MSDKCEHLSSIVEDNTYEGFSILRCTWECQQVLIELDRGNGIVVTYTIAELQALLEAVEAAKGALRAVVHDRPTAHSDEVWGMVLAALAKLEAKGA
jgi:phosphatidylglycerophosphatase A